VVLIRGGGSQLDLDCFNDYELCANIAQFPLPIITGIGHERDETIADMVAHTRQKTPTAVAEFLLQGFISFESKIIDAAIVINKQTSVILQAANSELQQLGSTIVLKAKGLVNAENYHLKTSADKILFLGRKQLKDHSLTLQTIDERHQNLDPKNILKRGYAFTTLGGKSIINKNVKNGDKITTHTLYQKIESTVTKTVKNGKI
jgi:exodeoxyribonuclease VII large subunit